VFSVRGRRLLWHRVIFSSLRVWHLVGGVVFIACCVRHFAACASFASTRVWHFDERRGFFLPCVRHLIAMEWHITRGVRCLCGGIMTSSRSVMCHIQSVWHFMVRETCMRRCIHGFTRDVMCHWQGARSIVRFDMCQCRAQVPCRGASR
jgi:hypothetical protein